MLPIGMSLVPLKLPDITFYNESLMYAVGTPVIGMRLEAVLMRAVQRLPMRSVSGK